jgi:hypothetical protein
MMIYLYVYKDILCHCNNTNHQTKFIAKTPKTGTAPLCDCYMSVNVLGYLFSKSLAHRVPSGTQTADIAIKITVMIKHSLNQ